MRKRNHGPNGSSIFPEIQSLVLVAIVLALPACKDSFSQRSLDISQPGVGQSEKGGAGGDETIPEAEPPTGGNNGNPTEPSVLKPYQCGTDDGAEDGPGIIGGKVLKRKSLLAGSMAYLFQYKVSGRFEGDACTATLIAPDVLLTAAHCVVSGDPNDRAARVRAYFHTDPYCSAGVGLKSSDVVEAEQVIVHPDYAGNEDTMKFDLALVKLKSKAPEGTRPMRVAKKFIPMSEADPVYLAGFGVTTDYEAEDKTPPRLRYIKVKPFANPEDFKGIQNVATSPRLILDQNGGGACRGDSGGPAIMKNRGALTLIGVASQVFSRGDSINCKAYVLQTNLSFYNEWLKDSFNELGSQSANPFQ